MTEILLEQSLVLTPRDVSEHLRFPFTVKKGEYNKLTINFCYFPKKYSDTAKSVEMIKKCYESYGLVPEESDIKKELPLNNHITVALESPEGFVGAAHRHSNEAEYTVSPEKSDYGFITKGITAGVWTAIISTHAILSERVEVRVKITAYD